MTNIKRFLIGLVLILLLFTLTACGQNEVPTQTQPSSFERAHSANFYIACIKEFRDKPHKDNYQLTECETIWNDSKFDLVYFSIKNFPDLAPGQTYLIFPVDRAAGAAYEVNHGFAMDQDGYFHFGFYPEPSGSSIIDDYNNAIKENNENENRIQSMPTEYLEGDVTLEELIAFFEAMHDAYIEIVTN